MTEKTLTTENIKPALDALRGELAPWPVVAKKQDRLNTAQLNAANSGITSSLVAQIIANTAAIRALESAITGTGLRALVVASLPAVGTTGILYIVPVTTYDPDTDADVVNYSNEYIWIPVEGGTASEGHYEQVGQTGIVINNGQLTITVNGTSVGTFTANQSGDTTAAITVPTNADYVDRTTDQTVAGKKTWTGEQSFTLPIVGSITGTASKAIADEDGTSIKTGYVNVAGNQTVTGNKEFTGSNTFNNILPNATNTYNLGSSSYQWSSVYAQTYYYNGTAWGLDKENVWTGNNRFVKHAGLSDISTYSDNTMAFNANANTIFFNTRGSSNYPSYGTFLFAGYASDPAPDRYGQLKLVRSTDIKGGTYDGYKPDSSFNLWRVAPHYSLMDFMNAVRVQNDGTNNYLAPITTKVTDLGTSTNKWKTLNGINPGALSLPNPDALVEIDTTGWNVAGALSNTYTPVVNGWLAIDIKDTATNSVFIYSKGLSFDKQYSAGVFGNGTQGTGRLSLMMPAIANVQYAFVIKADSLSDISYVRFYPCLGNV